MVVALPPGVVTVRVTAPAARAGATAVICVAEFTVNESAAVPPKLTEDAESRLVPVITTLFPPEVLPDAGFNAVMVGAETE